MDNWAILLMEGFRHLGQRAVVCLQYVVEVDRLIVWPVWRQPLLHALQIGAAVNVTGAYVVRINQV